MYNSEKYKQFYKENIQMLRARWRTNYRKRNKISEGELQKSDLHKGIKWEEYAEKYFKNATRRNTKDYFSHDPYDLDTELGKVDVKSVNAWTDVTRRRSPRWYFWIRPRHKKFVADYYFIVCLIKDVVIKCYLIPGKELGYRLSLGNKSKYDKYLVGPQGKLEERVNRDLLTQVKLPRACPEALQDYY
jgi:hypothetical protein